MSATEDGSTAPNAPEVDFESMYEGVKDNHCTVDKVYLEGFDRTKFSVIQPAVIKLRSVESLEELRLVLLDSWDYLNALGIFNAVELTVVEGRPERPNTCNVRLRVLEKGVFSVHTGAYAQGKDGSVEVSVGMTNPLGVGEQLVVTGEYGISKSNECAFLVRRSRLRGLLWDGEFRVLQHNRNQQLTSSFVELLCGGSLSLKSSDGHHGFDYLMHWRHISDPHRQASRDIIHQLGNTLKSSLQYTYAASNMEEPVTTTPAYSCRAVTEVAGVGPSTSLLRFVKQHVGLQWGIPLAPGSALVAGLTAGLLLPWPHTAWGKPTCISDRFFLGGPASLWGFQLYGVGPTDERRSAAGGEEERGIGKRDALGGDLSATAQAALRFELPSPTLRELGIYGHTFVQGGTTVLLAGVSQSLREQMNTFWNSFRWTMGIGLVWPTMVGNMELNFCQVLKSQPHDRLRNGLEFGFSPRLP